MRRCNDGSTRFSKDAKRKMSFLRLSRALHLIRASLTQGIGLFRSEHFGGKDIHTTTAFRLRVFGLRTVDPEFKPEPS